MTRYGVLGSGEVGRTLAEGFVSHGDEARIGSRSPGKLADYSRKTGIAAGSFADVAAWGESLVPAVKGLGAEDALRLAEEDRIAGKLIIDTTNPITDAPPQDGVLSYFTGPDMGKAVAARAIEPPAVLWCIPGFLQDRWTHAFKVLWQ
jgi:predicted dinucleotide-binding enzyme